MFIVYWQENYFKLVNYLMSGGGYGGYFLSRFVILSTYPVDDEKEIENMIEIVMKGLNQPVR